MRGWEEEEVHDQKVEVYLAMEGFQWRASLWRGKDCFLSC
jgi:hypothetical protein